MPSSKRRRSDPSSCRRRIYSAAALAFSSAFLFGLATKFEWIAPDSWLDFAHKPKPDYGTPLDPTSLMNALQAVLNANRRLSRLQQGHPHLHALGGGVGPQ